MKKRKLFINLGMIALAVVLGIIIFYFLYNNKKANSFENKEPDYKLNAKALYENFKSDKIKAAGVYNGKLLQIKGNIKTIEKNSNKIFVIFSYESGEFGYEGVRCEILEKYNEEISSFLPDEFVVLKGYCKGYEDNNIIMEKCVVINNY